MMNDITPPTKPQSSQQPASQPLPVPVLPAPSPAPARRSKLKYMAIGLVALLVLAIVTVGAIWLWYASQLQAVSPGSDQKIAVTVKAGTGPAGIAALLKDKQLIRSEAAFNWYVRLHQVADKLQAGPYRLSKGDDVPKLVRQLTSGDVDTFSVTFLPGDTLEGHEKALKKAGFSEAAIAAAFAKTYDLPLFADKPASANLEGYIYGETYEFPANASAQDVLIRSFEEFSAIVKKDDLATLYKKQGLTLYEGITLASIIQREVTSPADQQQVAQVFYLRLKKDMPLGSDVTYQYIADKTGQARSPNLDSPYNTRKYPGLPPGPIASPGASALYAVAHPAKGEYLYFLSGDDGKTYFAHTNTEHEANIEHHCQEKCKIL
ncbi:Aminodeoxychorismate lyase [Candidatus Saccharibacteria bacterium RAAC3_TM7_1]|nr:Aminodeoxychorismate lyase [Candidatus Saccharibacteria bacterium RAAC3_TM7_1]